MTSVVVRIVRPPAGSAKPNASNSAFKPWASAKPRPSPTAEATTPTTIDSPASDQNTWRRSAPIALSSADERWRWAAMIENVLLMLNVATRSATPANTSRKMRRKPTKSALISSFASSTRSLPLITSTPSGVTSAMRSTSASWLDPVVGLDEKRRHASGLTRHVRFGPRQRERGERRRTETVLAAERRDPDDLDLDRLRRGDDRVIADRQVAVLRGAPVDHHLVVGDRGAAVDELVGVELGILDPVAGERRRALATELLAVSAGQLTEALDLWCDDGDAVDLGELGRQSNRR